MKRKAYKWTKDGRTIRELQKEVRVLTKANDKQAKTIERLLKKKYKRTHGQKV